MKLQFLWSFWTNNKYLDIKQAYHYSTLQKFYKRMPTGMFDKITKQLIENLNIKPQRCWMGTDSVTTTQTNIA